MANTLTALQPLLYSAAQEVSNEPFGAVTAINTSFDDKGVAVGDKVRVPIAPTRAASNYTPSMTSAAGDDSTASNVEVEITANKMVSWNLTGEQLRSLENGGNAAEWARQLVAQGMRSLRNSAEADAIAAIHKGASRGYKPGSGSPFDGTDKLGSLVAVRKILLDNGAPMSDLQFVIDSGTGVSLRNLGIIQQADQAGSDAERRSGFIQRQFGFSIRESAGIIQHVKGNGTTYTMDGATAKGVGSLVVKSGTPGGAPAGIVAGDVIKIGTATDLYVVNTGVAGAAGTVAINRPGLITTTGAADAIAIQASYTPCLAFERSAVVGIMRPPVMPDNPLMQRMLISDTSGLTYMLVQVAGDGMATWRLHLCWGFQAVQSEHIALVMA